MRGLYAPIVVALAVTFTIGGGGLAANATQPDSICDSYAPNGTDKIDTVGDPATVSYTAPDGYLVDQYCVKAGTEKFIIDVIPPSQTVTIDHPVKDSVSHYAVRWVAAPAPIPTADYSIGCEGWYVDLEKYEDAATLTLTVDGIVEFATGTFGGNFYDEGTFTGNDSEHTMVLTVESSAGNGTEYDIAFTYTTDDCDTTPPPPVDVCLTIDGIADPTVQTTLPSGLVTDGAGNCTTPPPPPTYVCPNLGDDLTEIPEGYKAEENGDCVLIVVPPVDKPKTTVPGGATDGGDIVNAVGSSFKKTSPDNTGEIIMLGLLGGIITFLVMRRIMRKRDVAASS